MANRLYRSETDKILGGVCGGLAQHFEVDPSLIRIITIVLIFSGLSPLLYLIAWLIIPSESQVKGSSASTEEEKSTENAEDE